MNLDQDIRTMLRARAEGVAAAPMIPHSTLRRVRVRKTLMTGSVAAVVAALVFGGFAASGSLSNDAAPIPPAEGTTEEVDGVSLDTTFVSPRNGFSIKHPESAVLTPAKQLWVLSKKTGEGFDVLETGSAAVFKGASQEISDQGFVSCVGSCRSVSIDEWVDENVTPRHCAAPRSEQAEITIDGQSGRISECANRIEATVMADGRLYLFTLEHDRSGARAVFDAFIATIDLTPETAVDFPAMTTTFVSPTYGYSFKYHDRGGLAPATELWDPVNQPAIDDFDSERAQAMALERYHTQFDGVETGLGAFFSAASTQIPDGVSIDEWVDEFVTPTLDQGCGVPRSQQAEITIDGHSGRIAECDHSEATVVAGGRLYLFGGPADDRGWFDAWVDTIELTPETAGVP